MTKQDHYRSSGVPAFSAAGQDGFVDAVELRNVDAVILSAIGANCGRCFFAEGAWATLANVQVIIPDAAKAKARFLYFRTNRDDYWPRSGSAQPFIKPSDIRACWVGLPPLPEQEAITRVLDTLEITIRETEAIIEKLQLVKQALLHDLLTRGIDESGEVRPPQCEAPHLYKSSPVGWIPKDWAAGRLAEWLQGRPKNGYSPQPAGRWTGTQMLGLGCLTATGFQPRQLKDAPTGDPLVRAALLAPGDLLMSRANTRELVGLVGTYRDVGTPCCYPDLMMRLTPALRTSAAFLELVLRSPAVRRQIQSSASGTSGSMVKISGSIVMALNVSMPEPHEQARILECLAASDQRLCLERNSVAQVHALKSGLMDDLLTGRVRVTPLLT